MRGSRRFAVSIIVALAGLEVIVGAAGWGTAEPRAGSSSKPSHENDPANNLRLISRRDLFDATDGLRPWERSLLAMDPNGHGNPGR
jgi:hypothetical protein